MLSCKNNDSFDYELFLSEKKALEELDSLQRDERVINIAEYRELKNLLEQMYRRLRTPVFPKKYNKTLVNSIHKAYSGEKKLSIRGILASPTAKEEIPFFLRVMKIFESHHTFCDFELLLVRWDYLNSPQSKEDFEKTVESVKDCITLYGYSRNILNVVDINVEIDSEKAEGPANFKEWFNKINIADQQDINISKDLNTDLIWITQFYNRQKSLQDLGKKQALFDLAIRRYVGDRFSNEFMNSKNSETPFLILTSELNRRFLKCYRTTLPIANILVH